MGFHERAIEGLEQLRNCVGGPRRRGLLFRGYHSGGSSEGEDALITGLERCCSTVDGNLAKARCREQVLIRDFKRHAHHYLSDVPAPEQELEWMALMQHHGAPTRLLDVTYSPHAALHFALLHAVRHGTSPVVWMLNPEWCVKTSLDAASQRVKSLPKASWDLETEKQAAAELFGGALPPSVWPVNPFRLNERVTIQKGAFLVAADVSKRFVENLQALEGHEDARNVTKFVFPKDEIPNMVEDLYNANVTEAMLFPGLDGFARSLWTTVRFLSLVPSQMHKSPESDGSS